MYLLDFLYLLFVFVVRFLPPDVDAGSGGNCTTKLSAVVSLKLSIEYQYYIINKL